MILLRNGFNLVYVKTVIAFRSIQELDSRQIIIIIVSIFGIWISIQIYRYTDPLRFSNYATSSKSLYHYQNILELENKYHNTFSYRA